MEKKYNHSLENSEQNKLSEPAATYSRTSSDNQLEKSILSNPNRPCVFTDEEKLQQLEQGLEEMKNGKYISHEDVLQKIRRRYS